MPHDLSTAQQRLRKAVAYRQRRRQHLEYYAREVLTSDVKAVADLVLHMQRHGRYQQRLHASSANKLRAWKGVPDGLFGSQYDRVGEPARNEVDRLIMKRVARKRVARKRTKSGVRSVVEQE